MVRPRELHHRIKYHFWRVYTPYHSYVRDSITAIAPMRTRKRQPYLLGHIAPRTSVEKFVAHLVKQSYAYHRVAWLDDGEVVSLRRVEDFIFQYHIRIFEDGEVRAHYEYTPECHPISHLLEIGHEDRREEFFKEFGDHVIPHTGDDPHCSQSVSRIRVRFLQELTPRARAILGARPRPSTDRK